MQINPVPEIIISEYINDNLAKAVIDLGCRRVFIVTGPHISKTEGFNKILESLNFEKCKVEIFDQTTGDPTFNLVDNIVEIAKVFRPDIIIGIGGGSPLDAAKVVSILGNKNQKSQSLTLKPLDIRRDIPLILVPTTAGTGSEVTPISILTDSEKGIKTGIIHKELIPDITFLYGELTITMPKHITAATGIDALCHSIEAFLSKKSNPFSDLMAKESLKLISENLLLSFNEPENKKARSNMLLTSLYAGLSFSNSTVTAVHAFAYPLGGTYKIPHGLANSLMLVPVLKHNLLGNEDKMAQLASFLGQDSDPLALIEYIKQLISNLELPTNLKDVNIPESGLVDLAQKVQLVTRLLEVNPSDISLDDSIRIYKEAFLGYK